MSNLHFFNILFGNSRRNNINEIIEEASFSSFINLEELINNIDLSNIINDLSNQLTNIVDNMDFSYIYFDSSIILLDNSFIFSDSSFIFSEINSDNNRKKVLLNSDFEKLEKKKFNNNEALKKEYNLECPISLKDFNNNDEIIVLPCNHIFLEENIKKWLTLSSNDCPICRRKIIID